MAPLSNWFKEQQLEKKQPYYGLLKPTAFHAKGTSSPSHGQVLNVHQGFMLQSRFGNLSPQIC